MILNKWLTKLKIKLRNYKISKISFQEYSDYKNFFIQEDKKSNWESSTFSEIIEKYLKQNECPKVSDGSVPFLRPQNKKIFSKSVQYVQQEGHIWTYVPYIYWGVTIHIVHRRIDICITRRRVLQYLYL